MTQMQSKSDKPELFYIKMSILSTEWKYFTHIESGQYTIKINPVA